MRRSEVLAPSADLREWTPMFRGPATPSNTLQRASSLSCCYEGDTFAPELILVYVLRGTITPPDKSCDADLAKLREVIKTNKATKQVNLIGLLNPILRGWANYHSHVVAKKVFNQVDSEVWTMLWRWAVRRHPRKGTRWVKDKYFKVRGSRRWVFSTVEKYADGKATEYTLLKESDTPIVRHIKIKAAANPHDPDWDEYFEFRWGKKMLKSTKGRAKMYRVWRKQDGLCAVCHKPVTKDTPWHSRHIVKLAHGGTDAAINLEIYHLRCPRDQQYAHVKEVSPGA